MDLFQDFNEVRKPFGLVERNLERRLG